MRSSFPPRLPDFATSGLGAPEQGSRAPESGGPVLWRGRAGALVDGMERVRGGAGSPPLASRASSSPKVDVRTLHHGVLVRDPYRWLERPFSGEQRVMPNQGQRIEEWVNGETERFLTAMEPYRPLQDYVAKRYLELLSRPSASQPVARKGIGVTQWVRHQGEGHKQLLLVRESERGEENVDPIAHPNAKVLVDMAEVAVKLGAGKELRVEDTLFSAGNKILALRVSEFLSDWSQVVLVDTKTGEILPDRVEGLKWPSLLWLDDTHLVYTDIDILAGTDRQITPHNRDALASELRDKNAPDVYSRVRLHRVGQPQANDATLMADQRQPWGRTALWYSGGLVMRTTRLLHGEGAVLEVADHDYDEWLNDTLKFYRFVDLGPASKLRGWLGDSDRYIIQTNEQEDGSHGPDRLVVVDLKDPERQLQPLVGPVPGQDLEAVEQGDNHLLLVYSVNLGQRLTITDLSGKVEVEIDPEELGLPAGSFSGLAWTARDEAIEFFYESVLSPPAKYRLTLETRALEQIAAPAIPFDGSAYTVERVEYPSKDGTIIPMLLVHAKEGYHRDGAQPTLLYGYGGFDIDSAHLHFLRAEFVPFLEAGGTVAMPVLRGGSELGDAWHKGGRLHNKQNVFDDFIGAAEALIGWGYTRPDRLAIMGYSNGGLLVSAALTQRPELFGVAVPNTGVHDMVRYQCFSSGAAWIPELGDTRVKEEFSTKRAYSPYHNVRPASYPATLVATGGKDSRVDPSHSWKLAARLREMQQGDAPIYCYTNPDAGHFSNLDPHRAAEVTGARIGFIMERLGMDVPEGG